MNKNLKFSLKTDNCKLETTGVMVSLYTTSSTEKQLSNSFDLKDFYDNPIIAKNWQRYCFLCQFCKHPYENQSKPPSFRIYIANPNRSVTFEDVFLWLLPRFHLERFFGFSKQPAS